MKKNIKPNKKAKTVCIGCIGSEVCGIALGSSLSNQEMFDELKVRQTIEGKIVDVHNREIFEGSVEIQDSIIVAINRHPTAENRYIMPGFIDAHVHIESSMLTPEQFGRLVVGQGTIAVVSDPHEIANVLGVKGVNFMLENSKRAPLKIFFSIPSCVPATPFDVSGATVSSADVEQMAASGKFVALSEMMNVPGVLLKEQEVIRKLKIAKNYRLPIDGHAPLLAGEDLVRYISNGISTDHECSTIAEATQKIEQGMKVIIREGSAARNYEILKPLIQSNPHDVMFCTDDSHPNEILSGHIKALVIRSIANGFDFFDVLTIASINPINHYKLDVGQLRVGDNADFMVVDNLKNFAVRQVYVNGTTQIGKESECSKVLPINNFNHHAITAASLRKRVANTIKVMSLVKGELLTLASEYTPKSPVDNLESVPAEDIAKLVYINRYNNGEPQVAFCKGFHLQKGAFASSISHDSHNIIAVGVSDAQLVEAINAVIENRGALTVCCNEKTEVLPLPIAGIMSNRSGQEVASKYNKISEIAKRTGCTLDSPFMTLSFLSLVVIPEIKIGEKGLFSYKKFDWID